MCGRVLIPRWGDYVSFASYLDAIGNSGIYDSLNFNLYAYVSQNPITIIDLDGRAKDRLITARYVPETGVAVYTIYKSVWKQRYVINGDKSLYKHFKAESRRKISQANHVIRHGLQASTSIRKKVGTASAPWIIKNWISELGSIPQNLSGRINIRDALARMRPPPSITTPHPNREALLRQDVDEFVPRNQGGSTIKSNPNISNQGPLNSYINSVFGSADRNINKTKDQPITNYELEFK